MTKLLACVVALALLAGCSSEGDPKPQVTQEPVVLFESDYGYQVQMVCYGGTAIYLYKTSIAATDHSPHCDQTKGVTGE